MLFRPVFLSYRLSLQRSRTIQLLRLSVERWDKCKNNYLIYKLFIQINLKKYLFIKIHYNIFVQNYLRLIMAKQKELRMSEAKNEATKLNDILKQKMKVNSVTVEDIAHHLGTSVTTIYNKRRNFTEWTWSELKALESVLGTKITIK